jgi:hypothetical protein
VGWEVNLTDECLAWYNDLSQEEQDDIIAVVELLEERGPQLKRPFADAVEGSSYANMKELRIQHDGRPYRILFAFDPKREAILLIGGDKTGNDRWYEEFIPRADKLYAEHLEEIERGGK